ncbi:uncharacterized protein LOC117341217 [Pecten maximus]|uniref:uncharacterized protein LOC117341217 n=1 Tax=Pecten maximus TaxID=6579 RepID=UPI001458859E|nr:uncharacterized protein LOC117341217 [Pecten maximus]
MKNLKKKQQTNIEKAASCLELLELDLLTSSCISTVSSSKQSDATPSTPQLVVMPTPSIETQEVAVHQQSCSSVPETNFNSLSDDQDLTQSSTRSSSILGQSFDVLNNTSSCATYNRTGPDVQLQQRVEAVELELSKCWAYIHQLQNQVSWLYNQQQMNTVNYGNQPCSSGATTITESTPVQDAVTTNQMKATSLENRPTSLDTTTTTGQMSYTKEQLKSLCQGIDDYSKAGKRLFLRLFKREEYVGRSLTGKAPNRSTPAKPRIEDREKLQLLYDVVAELYGVRKESHINRELADLKPSRCR